MLSDFGKMFFFSSHLLHGVLNILDTIEHTFWNPNLIAIIVPWSSPYEQMIGFLLEGFVVIMEYENIDRNADENLQIMGEKLGNEIYTMELKILLKFLYSLTSLETPDFYIVVYLIYTNFINLVLKEYKLIFELPTFAQQANDNFFQDGKRRVEALITALDENKLHIEPHYIPEEERFLQDALNVWRDYLNNAKN